MCNIFGDATEISRKYMYTVPIFQTNKFPRLFQYFHSFPVFLKFFVCLRYGTIFAGFSLLLADKFPWIFQYIFSLFQCNFLLIFPVFRVRFLSKTFPVLTKFSDFSPGFPVFLVLVGSMMYTQTYIYIACAVKFLVSNMNFRANKLLTFFFSITEIFMPILYNITPV